MMKLTCSLHSLTLRHSVKPSHRPRISQPDPRSLIAGTENLCLDSPSLQTLYKWQGIKQLERALTFQDGNRGFYINDDVDAAYLVKEHAMLRGLFQGSLVEVTGAQARGQLLSMLLRHIDGRKTEALRKNAEFAKQLGYVEFAMIVERSVEQMEEASEEGAEMKARGASHTVLVQSSNAANETGASDKTNIEGLEKIQWAMIRPCSSTAADNDKHRRWAHPTICQIE